MMWNHAPCLLLLEMALLCYRVKVRLLKWQVPQLVLLYPMEFSIVLQPCLWRLVSMLQLLYLYVSLLFAEVRLWLKVRVSYTLCALCVVKCVLGIYILFVLCECFFWYRLTHVIPDKIQRAVKWLCVCVCANTSSSHSSGICDFVCACVCVCVFRCSKRKTTSYQH